MSKLALEHMFDSVVTSFTSDGINAVNYFGWRESAQHRDQVLPYIVWAPGDPSDSLGDLGAARYPGAQPKPLALLTELFTVYITAHDPSAIEDERAQYHVTRLLYDAWFRAVYRAIHGTFKVRSQQWLTGKTERRFGATLRVVCQVDAPILDVLPDEPLVGEGYAGQADGVDAVAHAAEANEVIAPDLTMSLNEEEDT